MINMHKLVGVNLYNAQDFSNESGSVTCQPSSVTIRPRILMTSSFYGMSQTMLANIK